MSSFKDTQGKEWMISLNTLAASRLRRKFGSGLFAVAAENWQETLKELVCDKIYVAEIVLELLQDQLAQANMTADDLAARMDGTVTCAAVAAFWAEYKAYLNSLGCQAQVQTLEKSNAIFAEVLNGYGQKLEKFNVQENAQKVLDQIEESLQKGLSVNSARE